MVQRCRGAAVQSEMLRCWGAEVLRCRCTAVQRWRKGGAKVLQRCRDGAEVSDAEVMQWFCIGSAAEVQVQRCKEGADAEVLRS